MLRKRVAGQDRAGRAIADLFQKRSSVASISYTAKVMCLIRK